MIRNFRTPTGAELGRELARLADNAEPAARLKVPQLPPRCASCALRAGRHLANQSPATQLDVVKCLLEKIPLTALRGDMGTRARRKQSQRMHPRPGSS